jgi:tRNA uridine 5-carboxymethylaminomethyl modification enzyme
MSNLLRRPGVRIHDLIAAVDAERPWRDGETDLPDVLASAEMEHAYSGYMGRERERVEALKRQDEFILPAELPYAELRTLSTEARQKLDRIRPRTLGQASRIPGISPSDLQNLVVEVRKRRAR